MPRDRAVKAANLEPTDRIPSQEWLDHPAFIEKVTGIDPFEQPAEATLAACKALDIDWLFYLPMQAVKFEAGETTKLLADGRQVVQWGFTGSHWEDAPPFDDVDDVLKYRPLEDTSGRVYVVSEDYRRNRIEDARRSRAMAGEDLFITGLYYTTLFQFGIMAFGWENFLLAAMTDPRAFDEILDQFTQISVDNLTEWVKDDCPLCVCHDDLAITAGLVFDPQWYRKHIFPRYERIFEPAKRAGKRIVFVSDGNYMDLLDDLFALGIDGVLIDCFMDLPAVLKRHGEQSIVIGNMDTRILTDGAYEDVKREVKRCAEVGKAYPGYFYRCAGDLPHNIPIANLEAYFDLKREYGAR